MNVADRVLEAPLAELAADAAALVDDLADFARTASETDIQVQIVARSPIRIAILRIDATPDHADLLAIATVPGAFGGHAVRWQRRGSTIEARDQLGSALRNLPDHQKLVARGDTRVLTTAMLRTLQRPAPASIVVGETHHVLVPELTVGRTAVADLVIPDDRLATLAWTHEWADDAWWVVANSGAGNLTLNGERGWQRRELSHDDVIASGDLAVRFVLAD